MAGAWQEVQRFCGSQAMKVPAADGAAAPCRVSDPTPDKLGEGPVGLGHEPGLGHCVDPGDDERGQAFPAQDMAVAELLVE